MLTEDELNEWKESPVTIAVLNALDVQVAEAKEAIQHQMWRTGEDNPDRPYWVAMEDTVDNIRNADIEAVNDPEGKYQAV